MTDRPTKLVFNCETQTSEEIELTDEEIAELEKASLEIQAQREQAEAEAQIKAEAKASALAKLAALGLTEEEAAAIAGA